MNTCCNSAQSIKNTQAQLNEQNIKEAVTAIYYIQLRIVKHMTSQDVQELLFTY